MFRSLLILAVLAGFLSGSTVLAGTVLLPEIGDNNLTITFDSADFATGYEVLSGPVINASGAVGHSLETFASIGGNGFNQTPGSLKISFASNLVNGDGIDLWLYKIGNREGFNLTIGTTTVKRGVEWTHETSQPHGYDVNLAKIDFSDMGFAVGDLGVNSFVMSSAFSINRQAYTTPDLAAAATNFRTVRPIAVPLPSAGLAGMGLLACALAARALRRRRR